MYYSDNTFPSKELTLTLSRLLSVMTRHCSCRPHVVNSLYSLYDNYSSFTSLIREEKYQKEAVLQDIVEMPSWPNVYKMHAGRFNNSNANSVIRRSNISPPPPGYRKYKVGCIFTIHDYRKKQMNNVTGDFYQSQPFGSGWYIKIYPKGEVKDNRSYMSLFVTRKNTKENEASVLMFKLWIEDSHDNMQRFHVCAPRLYANRYGVGWRQPHWGYPHFIEENFLFDPINKLKTQRQLTVCCEMMVLAPCDLAGH